MDENTIFQSPAAQPIQAPVQESGAQPVQPPSSGFLGKIIKIVVGLFVLIALFFLIFTIIIPKFFGKSTSGKITLTYWGLWEDAPIFQSTISDFERLYPNITVNYTKEDIKQYRERLVARVQNGRGPDIFRFHNSWVPELADVLLPLPKETISKEDFIQRYYPVAKADLIKNGAIYGIPLEIDTLSLYVNNDLFEAGGLTSPPATWVDFVNDARSLTVKDQDGKIKTSGAALGTFGNVTHAGDLISLLFIQNGVDLQNLSQNQQAAGDALTFYTSFAKTPGNVWDDTFDSSQAAFARGQLAMYFGYSWDFFAIKAANPNLSFSIYPVPHLGDQNSTIANYWAEGISSKSLHRKEALLFLNFLAKKETQVKLFTQVSKTRTFGEPYSLVELAPLLKDNPNAYPFVLGAPTAVSTFFADGTMDNGLNTQANTYLGNAVTSMLSGTSPQTAVDTLSQGITQLLQKYSPAQSATKQ